MYTRSQMKKGSLYITAAALCWSLGGVLIKSVPWSALAISGIRSLFALLVTLLFSRSFAFRFTKSNILGGLALSSTAFLFILSNQYTTAANAIVLQYSAPLFIALFSLIFQRKGISKLDGLGLFVILTGIVLFFFDDLSAGQMLGNILSILSGLCFATVFFVNSMPGATPMEATKIGHLISAIIGIPFAFTATGATADLGAWLAVITMGVVQLGLAYVFFSKGTRLVPPLMASLISCIEPVLNPVWVMLVIGEVPGFWAFVGMGVVIVGVIVYNTLSARSVEKKQDDVQAGQEQMQD